MRTSLAGPNSIDPERMTPAERLAFLIHEKLDFERRM
jgi:hypothetical protein